MAQRRFRTGGAEVDDKRAGAGPTAVLAHAPQQPVARIEGGEEGALVLAETKRRQQPPSASRISLARRDPFAVRSALHRCCARLRAILRIEKST